jgi:hypothetical protein
MFVFNLTITAQEDPEPAIERLLMSYLTGYCDEGEANTFIDFIQKNAEAVEPLLANFVKRGIPDTLIDSFKTNAVKQYRERQRLLRQDLNYGLTESELDSIKKESVDDFTDTMVREFQDGFMSQAIFGISLIDSDEAQAIIKIIASDKNSPYQRFAQNAVNQTYLKQE